VGRFGQIELPRRLVASLVHRVAVQFIVAREARAGTDRRVWLLRRIVCLDSAPDTAASLGTAPGNESTRFLLFFDNDFCVHLMLQAKEQRGKSKDRIQGAACGTKKFKITKRYPCTECPRAL
jgi:hypothetical protein